MLTRLMVRDWGPFDEKTVEFKPGKNVLYGKNFSGKTSLVNAMFYALTGEVLAPKAKPADFVKASSRDSIVELDLTLGTQTYRARRRPTRKQSHLLKLEGGSEVSEVASGSSVDSKVADLLEARAPELTQAIFMKEGEIPEYLASSTPMKRKEFVKSLIRLERLEEIAEAAKEWQSEVNARARELERAFAQTATNITVLKAKPLIGDMDRLNKEMDTLNATREALLEQKASLKDLADGNLKLSMVEERLEELNTERKSLEGKLGTEKGPYATADAIRSEMQSIATTPDELKTRQDAERELLRKRDEARGRSLPLQEALGSVQALKAKGIGECPTCHQKITPQILDSIIAEKKRSLEAVERELAQAAAAAQQALKDRQAVQDALDKKDRLRRRIETLENLQQALADREKEIARLGKEVEELRRKVKGAEKIGQTDAQLAEAQSKLEEAMAKRDQVVADQAALKSAEERMHELENRENEVGRSKALSKLLREACEATVVELGSIPIKKIEQLATGSVLKLGVFDGWHVDLEKNMLLPVAEKGDQEIQASTMAASEKMLTFLAIRFALAQSMVSSDFMVLDEPTEHLDSEHVEKIREFLKGASMPAQIIVTSNEPALAEGNWANVITL